MDVAFSVTSSVERDLTCGNYRGEPRWERNGLASLLKYSSHQLFLVNPSVWKMARPNNLTLSPPTNPGNVVSMSHASPVFGNWLPGAGKYVIHFYCLPTQEFINQIECLLIEVGQENIIITASFDSVISDLKQIMPKFRIRKLTYPYVEECFFDRNNFYSSKLLWSGRNLLAEDPSKLRLVFDWVSDKLEEDKNLTLGIMFGFDSTQERAPGSNLSIKDFVVQAEWFNSLRKYLDRVTFYGNMEWFESVELIQSSKLVIQLPQKYGGPTCEAAAVGIPSVGQPSFSNFDIGADWYLSASSVDDFLHHMERLYTDESFYNDVGSHMRTYVNRYYTFSRFVENLNSILEDLDG